MKKPTRIHLQSQISGLQILLWTIFVIAIGVLFFKTNTSLENYIALAGLVALGLVKYLFDPKSPSPYVSDILVYDKFLELIYKVKGRTVSKTRIKKSDITKFSAEIKISESSDKLTDCNIKVTISLQNKNPIFFPIKTNQLSLDCWKVHQRAINLVKNSKYLPNFSYEVIGSEYAAKELKKYANTGKGFTCAEQFTEGYKTSSTAGKVRSIVGIAVIISVIAMFLYFVIAINFLSR